MKYVGWVATGCLVLMLTGCGAPRTTTETSDGSSAVDSAGPPDGNASGTDSATPEALARRLADLDPGILAFNPPGAMKLGEVVRVEARIAPQSAGVSPEALEEGMGGEVLRDSLRLSTEMTVKLVGAGFAITPLSSETQVIDPTGPTLWRWDVSPTAAGTQPLTLLVSARVQLPGYGIVAKDLPVYERQVVVKVSLGQRLATFANDHLEWIVTGLLVPVAIWLINRRRRKPGPTDSP